MQLGLSSFPAIICYTHKLNSHFFIKFISLFAADDPLDPPNATKRKSGDNSKSKDAPAVTKMKFSLGSKKPMAAPLKISLNKPQVV